MRGVTLICHQASEFLPEDNHLIIDKHPLYEVKESEKIGLFIASPQGYYYTVFPPLNTKSSGFLNKLKPVITC